MALWTTSHRTLGRTAVLALLWLVATVPQLATLYHCAGMGFLAAPCCADDDVHTDAHAGATLEAEACCTEVRLQVQRGPVAGPETNQVPLRSDAALPQALQSFVSGREGPPRRWSTWTRSEAGPPPRQRSCARLL